MSRKALVVPFAAAVVLAAPAQAYAPQSAQPSTQRLFIQNKDFVTQKLPAAANTPAEQTSFYIEQICRTQSALLPSAPANANDKVAQAQAQVGDALKALSALPLTGQKLLEAASDNGVEFCPLDKMPIGVAALFLPDINAVASGPVFMGGDRMMQISHELTHAVQYKNGLLNYGYDWDIESRVQRDTATEAAAMTMEFLAAYDAYLHGNATYWMDLKENHGFAYGNRQIYKIVEDTYAANVAAGKSSQDALNAAGFLVWQQIFTSADWRTFYLNVELMSYMRDVDNGVFTHTQGLAHGQFTQDKVDAAGKIGRGLDFTVGEKMPSLSDILGGNKKMTWAFQAADIARFEQAWGKNDPRVKDMRELAAQDGNPYLNLDMKEMYHRARDEQWDKSPGPRLYYLYQVMDAATAAQAAEKTVAPMPKPPSPSSAVPVPVAAKPPLPPKAA